MESSIISATILRIVSQYSMYTNYMIISFGILGNIINILVFTHLKFFRNNHCIFYLLIETISNMVNQSFLIVTTILTSLYGNVLIKYSLVLCRINYILSQSCSLITFSMICFASGDQFFSTSYSFYLRQMCTIKLAQYLVFSSTIVLLLHSILFSFFVIIDPSIGCTISNPIWIQYMTYFFYPILIGLLPIIISSLFSFLAFRNVRLIIRHQVPIQRRRLDRQITAMILPRVIFYVLVVAPSVVNRIYRINVTVTPDNSIYYATVQLVQAILVSFQNLNCIVNFYIFIASSSRYRRQVKYVLVKRCWQRWKYWCCNERNRVQPEARVSIDSNNQIE